MTFNVANGSSDVKRTIAIFGFARPTGLGLGLGLGHKLNEANEVESDS